MAATDPLRSYNFKLIVEGVTEGHFTECSPLGVRVDTIAYREGGSHQIVRQLPGQTNYSELTLRYGLTESRDLFDWIMETAAGRVRRQNVSVLILDTDGASERVRWNLLSAWPREWRGAPLDALQSQVAIESLTLVYESLERE